MCSATPCILIFWVHRFSGCIDFLDFKMDSQGIPNAFASLILDYFFASRNLEHLVAKRVIQACGLSRRALGYLIKSPRLFGDLPSAALHSGDIHRRTLLHHAAKGTCGDAAGLVVRHCLRHMNLEEVNCQMRTQGRTSLHFTARRGEARVCNMLVRNP